MNDHLSTTALRTYAEKQLAAERYPNDIHTFRHSRCKKCGHAAAAVTINHHTGSVRKDFKGVILTVCSNCQSKSTFLSFTGSHRKQERSERPTCKCGSGSFMLGECERIESDAGISGFFDEGVIVGQCSDCGRKQTFVFTD